MYNIPVPCMVMVIILVQSVYLIIELHILFHVLYLTRPSHDNTTEQLPQLKSFDVLASDTIRRSSDTSDQRNRGMFSVSYTVAMYIFIFFHIE